MDSRVQIVCLAVFFAVLAGYVFGSAMGRVC